MLPSSALYRQALPAGARRECRVEVFHAGVRVADNLDVVDGSVSASLLSRVTRTAQLTVNPALDGIDPADILSPYTAVVKISAGIGYPNGSREIFPIFTGRVTDLVRDADGGVSISAEDLAADVIGFRFERPETSITGNTIVEEIHRLISQAIDSPSFGTDDVVDSTVPFLVWDEDRGRALDDLAQAVEARWYTLGDGSFVVRRYPYQNSTPVLSLADQSGGTVMRATRRVTRDNTANSITVVSERMDGTDPVRVTVRDVGSGSPTQFGAPYGKVSQIIKVQTPLSTAEATALAQAQLAASVALTEQWTLEIEPDHTLEPGDVISVSYRGKSAIQVIDQMTYPLVTGSMSIQGRASAVPTSEVD